MKRSKTYKPREELKRELSAKYAEKLRMEIEERYFSGRMPEPKELDWYGCYGGAGWGNSKRPSNSIIVPLAFKHPAKYARKLIRRIYEFAISDEMVKEGDTVFDPFGGVALGALDAITNGLNWVGIELEKKFQEAGNANIQKWYIELTLGGVKKLGKAILLQGDSRKLLEIIQNADFSVSSPPFNEDRRNVTTGETKGFHSYDKNESKNRMKRDYVAPETEGNLGRMPISEPDFKLAVSSPPYATIAAGAGGLNTKPSKDGKGQSGRNPESPSQSGDSQYGDAEGQMSKMKEGKFDLSVSSPPFGSTLAQKNFKTEEEAKKFAEGQRRSHPGRSDKALEKVVKGFSEPIGDTKGQMGKMPEGKFDLTVSSPPYEDALGSKGKPSEIDKEKRLRWRILKTASPIAKYERA